MQWWLAEVFIILSCFSAADSSVMNVTGVLMWDNSL